MNSKRTLSGADKRAVTGAKSVRPQQGLSGLLAILAVFAFTAFVVFGVLVPLTQTNEDKGTVREALWGATSANLKLITLTGNGSEAVDLAAGVAQLDQLADSTGRNASGGSSTPQTFCAFLASYSHNPTNTSGAVVSAEVDVHTQTSGGSTQLVASRLCNSAVIDAALGVANVPLMNYAQQQRDAGQLRGYSVVLTSIEHPDMVSVIPAMYQGQSNVAIALQVTGGSSLPPPTATFTPTPDSPVIIATPTPVPTATPTNTPTPLTTPSPVATPTSSATATATPGLPTPIPTTAPTVGQKHPITHGEPQHQTGEPQPGDDRGQAGH